MSHLLPRRHLRPTPPAGADPKGLNFAFCHRLDAWLARPRIRLAGASVPRLPLPSGNEKLFRPTASFHALEETPHFVESSAKRVRLRILISGVFALGPWMGCCRWKGRRRWSDRCGGQTVEDVVAEGFREAGAGAGLWNINIRSLTPAMGTQPDPCYGHTSRLWFPSSIRARIAFR